MKKTIKQLNMQALLESAVLASLAIWLLFFLISGRYLLYVTPRMLPYLIGTVIALIVLSGVTLTRLMQPNHRARVVHVFVLSLPLVMLLLPHGMISASSGQLSSVSIPAAQTAAPDATASPAPADAEDAEDVQLQPTEELSGLDRETNTITVTTDNFYDWMERFYSSAESYEGFHVIMTGYVINGSDVFAADEFALARLVMTCCVADLTPIGIICNYADSTQLEANAWVSVSGVLEAKRYEIDGVTYIEPQLKVDSLSPAEEISGYVYSY
jgi:putative membrane protein